VSVPVFSVGKLIRRAVMEEEAEGEIFCMVSPLGAARCSTEQAESQALSRKSRGGETLLAPISSFSKEEGGASSSTKAGGSSRLSTRPGDGPSEGGGGMYRHEKRRAL